MAKELFGIFIFGGIGCVLRFVLSKLSFTEVSLPLPTLVINVLGSFILSYIAFSGLKLNLNETLRVSITIGLLGGFTTFSTFSHQSMNLIINGQMLLAVFNIFFNVFLCLTGSYLGYKLSI